MYVPPAFREERLSVLYEAIRTYPLAMLVTHGSSGLTANLIPFTLKTSDDGRDVLRAHLARANAQLDDLRAGGDTLVIFQGPQAYVTPSWYATKREHGRVVPTWNYVMVQVSGRPQVFDDPVWVRSQIGKLTRQQESGRPQPWFVEDAPPEFVAAQIKGIVGVDIPITAIHGKWKASQNQPAVNRAGVIAGLRGEDPDSSMATVVEESVHQPPEK